MTWQQTITWTNADPELYRHMTPQGHNEFMLNLDLLSLTILHQSRKTIYIVPNELIRNGKQSQEAVNMILWSTAHCWGHKLNQETIKKTDKPCVTPHHRARSEISAWNRYPSLHMQHFKWFSHSSTMCNNYNAIKLFKNTLKNTKQLVCKGEIWDVFSESKLGPMSYYHFCCMSYHLYCLHTGPRYTNTEVHSLLVVDVSMG